MVDVFSKTKRSEIMSRVGCRDTQPEIRVRHTLHSLGFRFRLHRTDLPGKPDIVLPRHKKVIFVHGCFWHGHRRCPRAKLPSSNVEFWKHKIGSNFLRDKRVRNELKSLGWAVLIIWQCETTPEPLLLRRLRQFLD